MNLDHTARRSKVSSFRNQILRGKEHEILHVDSAVTAPYNSFTGVTLQKGAALSAEIENYRRRVITLQHFFDSISPHWWDQLHRFGDAMVKRPSRSADLIAKLQNLLKARLTRLTPRMVIPAAAAVVTIEELDIVPVLPTNLLQSANPRTNRRSGRGKLENIQETLKLAYSIARRLGEVERSKQQLILYAVEWINSDGRDFHLRAQRLALLTKNIKHCLIERYTGVQALITHYFRRRSLNESDEAGSVPLDEMKTDSKSPLVRAFSQVTAVNISTTSPEILRIIANADLTLATDQAFATDFIHNYSPNVLPITTFSLTPANTDVQSLGQNVSLEETWDSKLEVSADEAAHQEHIGLEEQRSPANPSNQDTVLKQTSIERESVKFGKERNATQPGSFRETQASLNDQLIALSNAASHRKCRSDSELRRRTEPTQFIPQKLTWNKSKSYAEHRQSNPKNTSSSDFVKSTALFRPLSSSEDEHEEYFDTSTFNLDLKTRQPLPGETISQCLTPYNAASVADESLGTRDKNNIAIKQ